MHYAALMSIADPFAAKFLVWFNALAIAGLLIGIGSFFNLNARAKVILLVLMIFISQREAI